METFQMQRWLISTIISGHKIQSVLLNKPYACTKEKVEYHLYFKFKEIWKFK